MEPNTMRAPEELQPSKAGPSTSNAKKMIQPSSAIQKPRRRQSLISKRFRIIPLAGLGR
jgi:hypothetical protein